jgi:hypothetical protein
MGLFSQLRNLSKAERFPLEDFNTEIVAQVLNHNLDLTLRWLNFTFVVNKAKTACEISEYAISAPFVDVNKRGDLATEITIFNAREHGMTSEINISGEHITNNQAVRKTLLERGIRPESLPAVEDVKKVERRIASQDKNVLKKPDGLRDDTDD